MHKLLQNMQAETKNGIILLTLLVQLTCIGRLKVLKKHFALLDRVFEPETETHFDMIDK